MEFSTKGLYSLKSTRPGVLGFHDAAGTEFPLAFAMANIVASKTYIAYAKVKTNATNPIAQDTVKFEINTDYPAALSIIEQQYKTVADVKNDGNVFVQIWTKFQAVVTDINVTIKARLLKTAPQYFINGYSAWVDEFEIYEYIDLGCNLLVDVATTVVVNESAPGAADGSITVAITGGDAPYEYSKDGAIWQPSNIFEDLPAATYPIRVREVADPTCVDLKSFDVHLEVDPEFDFNVAVTNESLPGEEDGSITGTKTGAGTGPFEWRLDGGGWQVSGLFEDLAPATYLVSLRDATGQIKSQYATVEAGDFIYDKAYFNRNPIPFTVGAQVGYEALENYRIYCDTRVEEEAGSGVFVSQLIQELEPDADGLAIFQLRQAFRKVLSAAVTDKTADLVILTDRIKLFKNYTGHLQDDEVTPAVLTPSLPSLILLGGIDKLNFPGLDYLTTYLIANKKFLTWAPLEKEVDRLQEDYLNYFVYDPLVTTLKVYMKAYFDDGTDQIVNNVGGSGFIQGQLVQVPVGPANTTILLADLVKNLVKYDVWLQDQDDNIISEVRTYVMAAFHYPLTRFLMILNSLGAWEVHKFTGQAESSEEYNRTIVQKFLPHDYAKLDGEQENRDVTSSSKHSFSSGYIKGPYAEQWMDYMREMARSKTLYEIKADGTRIPLMNVTRSFAFKREQNYERFIRIDAQDVYENESFTPEL